MAHPLANATPDDIRTIERWLKQAMIETDDRRYLDFVRNQNDGADIWTFTINCEVKAFATFRGPLEIETFQTHPSLSDSWKRLAAESLVHGFEEAGFKVATFVGDDKEARELMESIGFVPHKEKDILAIDLRRDVDIGKVAGRKVPFAIRFYPEEHFFFKDREPYAVNQGIGVLTDLQELHLPKAAIAFGDIFFCPSKTTVEIEVDGELIAREHVYRDLVRYLGAERGKGGVVQFEKLDLFTYKHLDFSAAPTWMQSREAVRRAGRG